MFCGENRGNGFAFILCGPVFLTDAERPVEKLCFHSAGRLPLFYDLVIDLLEKPRHGRHDGWSNFLQMRGDLVERSAIIDSNTVRTKHVENRPFKNVRKRKYRK